MLTQLRLENFKSWRDTGVVTLKPITGFFGPNSSGKTSLFQSLLLMKQSADTLDLGTVLNFGNEKTLVDLGDFESIIHGHDTELNLKFSLNWNARQEFVVPSNYGGGTITEGEDIGFAVDLREERTDSGKSLMLEEMVYRVAGRQFGVQRRQLGKMNYEMFIRGPDVRISRHSPEDNYFLGPHRFHSFPFWASKSSEDEDFFLSIQNGLTSVLRGLHYLGPTRAHPNRLYAWSGARQRDMGTAGEYVVDALLSSLPRVQRTGRGSAARNLTVEQRVAEWLKRLGLLHDFRVEALAEGRRVFEVKVQKSPQSAEVLLSDVGFGVSQILPVLALCFYVPRKPTVILEQPDIHLHPSVQAGLADVFIDAYKSRDVQILFESHSEHLLRRLQRRIAEGEIEEADVGLYFCSTDDSGSSNISRLKFDQSGNISNWPKDFFGDQFGEIAAMSEAALKRQGLSG